MPSTTLHAASTASSRTKSLGSPLHGVGQEPFVSIDLVAPGVPDGDAQDEGYGREQRRKRPGVARPMPPSVAWFSCKTPAEAQQVVGRLFAFRACCSSRLSHPADLSEELSRKTHVRLERVGVEVVTSSPVELVVASAVVIKGERVPSQCVFWTAGVRAAPLLGTLGVTADRAG